MVCHFFGNSTRTMHILSIQKLLGRGSGGGSRVCPSLLFFMINTILKTTCKPKRFKHIISERACSSATTIIVYKPYNPGNLSAVRS